MTRPGDTPIDLGPGRQGAGTPAYLSRAFGLTIRSDFPIEELPSAEGAPQNLVDLDIRRDDGLQAPEADGEPAAFRLRRPDGPPVDDLWWREVGAFRIIGADRITYRPNPGVGPDLLTLPLLGTVMAAVLHHRGHMVLHGSAVEIDGRAVVFVGDKGAGKSTTAASLVASGRRILTDDVVALARAPDGGLMLLPGYGQVKLTQTATEAIALPGGRVLDRPYAGYTKHRHVLGGDFDSRPVGVSDILVLDRGNEMRVEALTGHRAITALMRYAYLTRFGAQLFSGEEARRFLAWCGDVARTVTVGRLEVPARLDALARLDDYLSMRRPASPDPAG